MVLNGPFEGAEIEGGGVSEILRAQEEAAQRRMNEIRETGRVKEYDQNNGRYTGTRKATEYDY